ncbi:hypothetical protein Y697_14150 [Mesotoga sp. BH458_6_3_2_1]|nr:hypothetical protein Y697_14150 [Mesotoga sp. BH458_6_3_2_1]
MAILKSFVIKTILRRASSIKRMSFIFEVGRIFRRKFLASTKSNLSLTIVFKSTKIDVYSCKLIL